MITKRRKHLARNTNHVLHLSAHQTEDRKTVQNAHVAAVAQVLDRRVKIGHLGVAHVHGDRDVHLGRGDQIHRDLVLVEDGEEPRQESVRDRPLVGVDVDDGDLVLDGHGRGTLGFGAPGAGRAVGGAGAVGAVLLVALEGLVGRQKGVGLDDGALAARVLDVLDADGDRRRGLDHLVHGQVVDNFGAVEGQLGGLGGRDGRDEARRGHLGWVGGEDAVDFLPDLQLVGFQAYGRQRGAQVRVATADVAVEQAARYVAEEAGDDWYAVLTGEDLLGDDLGRVPVEGGVEPLDVSVEVKDVGQVDVFGVDSPVFEKVGHEATAELLAEADDSVLCPRVYFEVEPLGGFQILGQ